MELQLCKKDETKEKLEKETPTKLCVSESAPSLIVQTGPSCRTDIRQAVCPWYNTAAPLWTFSMKSCNYKKSGECQKKS